MRVLCLHGYQQSGDVMKADTEFLQQVFDDVLGNTDTQLVYITAPNLAESEGKTPSFSWWPTDGNDNTVVLTAGYLSYILDNEGPFDGAVGFSQGGMVSCLVAACLEQSQAKRPPGFITEHPPLRFAVLYGAYREEDKRVDALYAPRSIKTPMIHFISATDPVIPEERSLRLVESCADSEDRVVLYTGSGFHRVPQTKTTRAALAQFLEDVLVTEP